MIAQTNLLVRELRRQDLIELKVIDSTQRYRDYHDLSFFSRVWGGSWQAGRIAIALLVLFLRFKPDAVVIRSSASMGLVRDFVLCALARLLGAPADVAFHFGRIPELAVQRNWEWRLLGLVIRTARTVSVLDRCSRAVLVDSFPNSRIAQIPNAVDLGWIDEIRGRANPGRSKRAVPLFVFVGVVLASKGVVELVDACSRVDADLELEMVGPVGPEMKVQLYAIAAKREGGRWLRFTGAVSNGEALERIAAADVFVLPSYTEGFPVSVLEAMALGTAIVATRVGAIPEMLQGNDGEAAGIIVPPRDTESLKLAMEDLLQNPAKRSELGAAARRKCEANYQLSDHARRIVSDIWPNPGTGAI
jgi:glycosyltransferase involved in cell wall biosynthesis